MTDQDSRVPVIHLMLPTGARLTYDITKKTTVADIVARLSEDSAVTHPPDRRITLIYRGRVLKPRKKIAKLDTLDEFTIQVFYRAAEREAPAAEANGADLRGFDRLRRMNVSDSYIENIRRQFHAVHGSQDAPAEQRIELEEEWFPVIFNQENPMLPFVLPGDQQEPGRRQAPGILNNEEEQELEFGTGAWLHLAVGLSLGGLFGVGSLVCVVIAPRDRWFLIGLFAGSCLHYIARYVLGLEVV